MATVGRDVESIIADHLSRPAEHDEVSRLIEFKQLTRWLKASHLPPPLVGNTEQRPDYELLVPTFEVAEGSKLNYRCGGGDCRSKLSTALEIFLKLRTGDGYQRQDMFGSFPERKSREVKLEALWRLCSGGG